MKTERMTLIISLDVDERIDPQEVIMEVGRAVESADLPMNRASVDCEMLEMKEQKSKLP